MKRLYTCLWLIVMMAGLAANGAVQAQDGQAQDVTAQAAPGQLSVGSKFITDFCMDAGDGNRVVVNKCDAQPRQGLRYDDNTGQLIQGSNCLAAPVKGQPLMLKPCAAEAEQQWTFVEDGTLKTDSGLCADILNFWRDPGTSIIAWDCTATDNQKWFPTNVKLAGAAPSPAASGPTATGAATQATTITGTPSIASYFVQGTCLDSGKHATVTIENCSRKASQSLHFATGNSGAIQQDTQCLASADKGTPLVLGACNGAANQAWTFTADGSLRNGAGLCADIFQFGTRAGTTVIAWDCTGTDNQKWYPAVAAAAGSFSVTGQVAGMLNDGKTTTVSLAAGYSSRNMTGAGGKTLGADGQNNVTGGLDNTIVVGGAGIKTVNFVKGLAAASVTAAAKTAGASLLPTDWGFFSGTTAGTFAP